MRFAADDVHEAVIAGSGHWLMEEQPVGTSAVVGAFLRNGSDSSRLKQIALNSGQVDLLARQGAGAGTSGVSGIQTTVLSGDPSAAGPYAIEIRVPPHTQIAAHSHRDERFAMVVSGEWHFGYGDAAQEDRATTLGSGAFYTEPADAAHFAATGDAPAIVYITGFGPTDTKYVSVSDRPAQH